MVDDKPYRIAHAICLLLSTITQEERAEIFEAAFTMMQEFAGVSCCDPSFPKAESAPVKKPPRATAVRGRPREHTSMLGKIEQFIRDNPGCSLHTVADHFGLGATANERHRISRKLAQLLRGERVTRVVGNGVFRYSVVDKVKVNP